MALVVGFVLFAILDPPLGVIALVAGALLEIGEAVFWTRYLRRYRVRTGVEVAPGHPLRGVAHRRASDNVGCFRYPEI